MKNIIIKNLSILTLQDFSFHVVGMVFFMFLARSLGQEGLGLYTYFATLLGFITLGFDLGVVSHFLRKWSISQETLREDIPEILQIKLSLFVAVGIPVLFYAAIFEKTFFLLYAIILLTALFDNLKLIATQFFSSHNAFHKVFIINAIDRYLSFAGGIVLLMLGQNIYSIFLWFLVAKFLSFLASAFFIPLFVRPVRDLQKFRKTLEFALPLFAITSVHTLYFKVDFLLIRSLLGFDALGAYTASYRVIEALIVLITILTTAIFPTVSRLVLNNKTTALLSFTNLLFKYGYVFSLYCALIFCYYSKEILDFLFGISFIESEQTLQILSWALLFMFISSPLGVIQFAQKQDRTALKRLLVLLCINLVGNYFAIQHFGIIGAAFTTLGCEAINFILLVKQTRYFPSLQNMLKPALPAALLMLFLSLAHPPLFLTLFITLFLYLAFLFLFRVVSKNDIALLQSITAQ